MSRPGVPYPEARFCVARGIHEWNNGYRQRLPYRYSRLQNTFSCCAPRCGHGHATLMVCFHEPNDTLATSAGPRRSFGTK